MLEIFNEWNPDSPRGPDNFNPFERDAVGNQCDPNGFFPGDTTYRDPIRPDMNFARMQEENAIMADLKNNPKFSIQGKPGCLK
ncbi:unnamed protein product [Heterosigma akashiwo]